MATKRLIIRTQRVDGDITIRGRNVSFFVRDMETGVEEKLGLPVRSLKIQCADRASAVVATLEVIGAELDMLTDMVVATTAEQVADALGKG